MATVVDLHVSALPVETAASPTGVLYWMAKLSPRGGRIGLDNYCDCVITSIFAALGGGNAKAMRRV